MYVANDLNTGSSSQAWSIPSPFDKKYLSFYLGWKVTEDELKEVAGFSNILHSPDDFLHPEFRRKCEAILQDPLKVKPGDCVDTFLYLKTRWKST